MAPGLKKFEILLDRPNHTFSPGEIIAGRVIVDLKRLKRIRGLKVTIKGKAEVNWSETTGRGKDKKTTHYTGEEEYFRMEFYMLGRAGNSENLEIQKGYHEFPFNFCLPHNIPSSFETMHGSIRYTVKAVMDRPWKFDHEKLITFTVETPCDLSQYPTATTPIVDEEYKTFCFFSCLKMGAMKVNIFLPTSGFTIGEAIQAKINIYNTSTRVDVTKVKLRLEQNVKLYSRFPNSTKMNTNVVQNVKKNGPFNKEDEIVVNMKVPSLPCSSMVYCGLIDIEYQLKVIIAVSGCHFATEKKYPIVIGRKPALSVQSLQNGTMSPTSVPTLPFFPIASTMPMGTMPMPYSSPHPELLPRESREEDNATALGFSKLIPIYGVVPSNQPYPPTMPAPIGFVTPNPAQPSTSIESTENPPPSYNEAMGINRKH